MSRVLEFSWHMFLRILLTIGFSLRIALWTVLTIIRVPVVIVGNFLVISGVFGGMFLLPLIIWAANNHDGKPQDWAVLLFIVGIGFGMTIVGSMGSLLFDSLLLKLEPKDRITIY